MIGVTHFFVNGGYMYVVDNEGQIWTRHVPVGEWEIIAELPEKKSPSGKGEAV